MTDLHTHILPGMDDGAKDVETSLTLLRMEAAQGFLREEGLSIAETANRVGYFNISHFIKCFKTYTGMTPGEWKKLSSGK